MPSPFRSGPFAVRPEWIDENGHLNLAYYVVLFDWATDAVFKEIGLGDTLRAAGFGTFAVETHTLYLAELRDGDQADIESVVVGADGKRLHLAHEMFGPAQGVSAQQELMYLCVDLETRRSAPWPRSVAEGLRTWVSAAPAWIGRRVSLSRE